jgi:hypothetical protein
MLKICSFCDTSFEAKSEKAKFCSASCKTKASNCRKAGLPEKGKPPVRPSGFTAGRIEITQKLADLQDKIDSTANTPPQRASERTREPRTEQQVEKRIVEKNVHQTVTREVDLKNQLWAETIKKSSQVAAAAAKHHITARTTTLSDSFADPYFHHWTPTLMVGGAVGGGCLAFMALKESPPGVRLLATLVVGAVGGVTGKYLGSELDRKAHAEAAIKADLREQYIKPREMIQDEITFEQVRYQHRAQAASRYNAPFKGQRPLSDIETPQAFSAAEAQQMVIPHIKLPGDIGRLLGQVRPNSQIGLYAAPDAGKTTLLLQTAQEMSYTTPVLYVSTERDRDGLIEHTQSLGVKHKDLTLVHIERLDSLFTYLSQNHFKVIIIDSANGLFTSQHISSSYLKDIRALTAHSLVFHVIQATKGEEYHAPENFKHEIDILIELTKNGKEQKLRMERKKGNPDDIAEVILRPKMPANVHPINAAEKFHV